MEKDVLSEKQNSHAVPSAPAITLQDAVNQGEYDPAYLATFPEWLAMPRHTQFLYIKTALQNRQKQLLSQWAEINNILDFSQKPHLQEALRNIEKQQEKIKEDKEKLWVEYSV